MQNEPNFEQFEQIINQGMNANGQVPPDAGMFVGIFLFAIIFGLIIGLAIQAVICVFLSKPLKVIPEQYRLMTPGMVWLLMIPCFSLVWNFFVYPKIAKSLKQFANAQGNHTVGDCGETLGWVYCGLVLGCLIPYLGGLVGIAALVLMIIYLVKVNTIAGQLSAAGMQIPTASAVPPEQPGGGSF